MTKCQSIIIFLIIFFSNTILSSWGMEPQSFNKDSYQQILNDNIGIPFLLVIWSIDCPPCYEELMMLGQFTQKNPEKKIILISTDSFAYSKEVSEILIESNLHNQEQWVFSDIPSNQLRYSIDPAWYGELPRSYFFNQKHKRTAVSGRLNIDVVKTFF